MNIHEVCERVRQVILAEFPRGLTIERDYDVSVRDEGKALLEVFRDGGGREVVMVLSSAVHRLLGATVAMIVRIPIKIFATRAEALRYIEQRLAG